MTRRAFTLTEMLVVLGIILVLMGLLFPMILRAQRSAKLTQCQTRLRAIGAAMEQYLHDYDSYLPPAGSSNSGAGPGSPTALQRFVDVGVGAGRGMTVERVTARIGTKQTQLWPEERGGDERSVGPPGYPYSVPPLAYFLKRYLGPTAREWSCPAAPRNDFSMSALAGPTEDDALVGALAGSRPIDSYSPGYRYMGTAEFWFGLHSPEIPFNPVVSPPLINVAKAGMWHIWLSRNIGGLPTHAIKTLRNQGPSEIVLCFDRTFTNHVPSNKGALVHTYTNWLPEPSNWVPDPAIDDPKVAENSANFLYLDGHIEHRKFESKARFVRLLHDQVLQRWGYVKLLDRTGMEYPWQVIGKQAAR